MSRREPKAGGWLRQQVEELGALRNASVRDPQFKAWRQNTLTFIQRIWPGDATKSERFRRIPFSPSNSRADARTGREHFERGCGEALEYLNSLLEALGEEKVAPGTTRSITREPEPVEAVAPAVGPAGDEVPDAPAEAEFSAPSDDAIGNELDLDPPPSATDAAKPRSTGPSRLPTSAIRPITPEGLPEDFAGATPLDSPDTATRDSAKESAPRISVSAAAPPPPPAPSTPRPNPLKDILAPHRKEAAASARSARTGRGRKGGKSRLKDMLGLAALDSEPAAPPAAAGPVASSPVASSPTASGAVASGPVAEPATPNPAPIEPAVAKPTEPVRVAPPVAPAAPEPPSVVGDPTHPRWEMPEFLTPAPPASPLTARDVEPAPPPAPPPPTAEPPAIEVPAAGPPNREVWRGAEPVPMAAESNPPAPVAEKPAATAAPAGEALAAARVTMEFMKNSPVLSSMPRAVQRPDVQPVAAAQRSIPSGGSAAGRMLAIAAEVDSLGVPEGQRARARAALMDLARQLDEPEVSWEVLREAVQFVMEFPPLARRALPLLLPFLDIAA